MKTLLTFIGSILVVTLLGGLLWSCDKWDLPTRKTQRNCVKPSGSLTATAQERKVDFVITEAKGTIDRVVWDFGGGGPNSTTSTTGLTASYTYPTSSTYTAKATVSNSCGDETVMTVVVSAFDVVLPVVNVQSAANIGVTSASVSFVVTNPGNPNAVEYGIYYSTNSNPDATNSITVTLNNVTAGVSTPVNLINLTANTKYYYRTYAKLSSGRIIPGATVESFTTQVDSLTQDLIASVSFTNKSQSDISGYGNDVFLVDNTTFTTDHKGNANSAILLDGDKDYFYMKPNSILDQTNALSISIWIKPTNKPLIGTDGRMQIYNKARFSDGANPMYSSLIKLENDLGPNITINTDVRQGGDCDAKTSKGWQTFSLTSNPDFSQWHHVVMTYSGHTGRMYFDGALLSKKDDLPNNSIDYCPGAELKFGAQMQSPLPWYFKGAMDDIRIYKKVLTDDEVKRLFNQ